MVNQKKYLVSSNIHNNTLTKKIEGKDQDNKKINTKVIQESSLTIFLNNQEIVTLMCILDHPTYLAIGYLLNQNMIKENEKIKTIDYDSELKVIIIRTSIKTNYEKILKKKITTSGCAQGTIYGNIY
jgi:FdhD protein